MLPSTGIEGNGLLLRHDTDILVQNISYVIESGCWAVSDVSLRPRTCNCISTLKRQNDQVVRRLRQEKNEAAASNVVSQRVYWRSDSLV